MCQIIFLKTKRKKKSRNKNIRGLEQIYTYIWLANNDYKLYPPLMLLHVNFFSSSSFWVQLRKKRVPTHIMPLRLLLTTENVTSAMALLHYNFEKLPQNQKGNSITLAEPTLLQCPFLFIFQSQFLYCTYWNCPLLCLWVDRKNLFLVLFFYHYLGLNYLFFRLK